MAYDLDEQEQLASLKAFWDRWGNAIVTVVTVVALGFAAHRLWQWYETRQAQEAAVLFDQWEDARLAGNAALVKDLTGKLISQHSGHAYAGMAALGTGAMHLEKQDRKSAQAMYEWAVKNAALPQDRQVARLRLAGVLLDSQAPDEALKVVAASEAEPAFAPLFADRRGDVHASQGRYAQALVEYNEGLALLDKIPEQKDNPIRPLLQMKRDHASSHADNAGAKP